MRTGVQSLKLQFVAALCAVVLAFATLCFATYAWYVSNTSVNATMSTISAKSNNFVLQIAKLAEGAQRGDNQSLVAVSDGHKISPSSTDDAKQWYVCDSWGQDGKVYGYSKLDNLADDGSYTADVLHYAYIKSEYILYTVLETGSCDAYLDGSNIDGAIQVTAEGEETTTVVPDSMRVGITIQDLDGTTPVGDERLVLVYAPKQVAGKGNDATAIEGWSCVKDVNNVGPVSYPHIYEREYVWTDSNGLPYNFAAEKIGENYEAPSANGSTIASDVDYDGKIMRVYIWLEGTDADCINNSNQDDPSTYSVTINLAGVAK